MEPFIIVHDSPPVASSSLQYSTAYTEALICGIYCALALRSLAKHFSDIRRNAHYRQLWSQPWLLFTMSAVMFFVGATHSSVSFWQIMSSHHAAPEIPPDAHDVLCGYVKLALEIVNCFMGDAIMISVALTIERRMSPTRPRTCPPTLRGMLNTLPILLLPTSLATGIGMVYASAGRDVLSGAINHRLQGCFIAWTSVVLATNLITTIIFVYEFRSRRQSPIGRVVVSRGQLDILLLTLTWSGILYCCTLTMLLILFVFAPKACYVLNHMMPQLAGVYPMLAVVAVAIRRDNAPSPILGLQCRIAPLYEFSCECCRQRSSVPLAKERDGFQDPFSTNSPQVSRAGSPTVASMTLTGPTYPSATATGLRQKLQSPFASSNFNVPRKGSEASNISLPSAVFINVEVETTVDEGYVPKALTLPLGQSSSLSLLDSRLQPDSDSVAHEANSIYREPAVLAKLAQADLEAVLRLETPFPSPERVS